MTEHRKVSQFWVSESGMLASGRKEHGYFVVCSCGAEIYSGPSAPYDMSKPPRLEELEGKAQLTVEEEKEMDKLWNKWDATWRMKLEESNQIDHQNMRKALQAHIERQQPQETRQP